MDEENVEHTDVITRSEKFCKITPAHRYQRRHQLRSAALAILHRSSCMCANSGVAYTPL